MKVIATALIALSLSGCAAVDTVKKYWPRDHDDSMFVTLVDLSIKIEQVDCEKPDWSQAVLLSERLARYTEWRNDPQKDNMKGLYNHTQKMASGGSKTFCEIGKKTAGQRIQAAKNAWGGR